MASENLVSAVSAVGLDNVFVLCLSVFLTWPCARYILVDITCYDGIAVYHHRCKHQSRLPTANKSCAESCATRSHLGDGRCIELSVAAPFGLDQNTNAERHGQNVRS